MGLKLNAVCMAPHRRVPLSTILTNTITLMEIKSNWQILTNNLLRKIALQIANDHILLYRFPHKGNICQIFEFPFFAYSDRLLCPSCIGEKKI